MPPSFTNYSQVTRIQSQQFARSNLTNLVYTTSRFEGLTTTWEETQTIIDGMSAAGVPIDDVLTIVNLKRGWQFVIDSDQPLTLVFEKRINSIVAAEDALVPGELRTGQGGVDLGSQDYFEPPKVNEQQENEFLNQLLATKRSTTDKALTLMYHNMRQQLFWDGNKRTATLAANKLMIDGGAGLINVPLDKWDVWNSLISDYYRNDDMIKLKQWTYENGIQGVDL